MTSRSAIHCKLWRGGALCLGIVAFINGALLQPAFAEEPLDLHWNAPADCPQADAVQQQVRALVGEVGQRKVTVRAEGRVEAVGGRYRLTLVLRDGDRARKRTIHSDSCVDLAGAAAVALGLFLRYDPAAVPSSAPSPTTPPPDATNTAAPSDVPPEPPPTDTSPTPPESPAPRRKPPERKSSEPAQTPDAPGAERHWHLLLRAPLGVLDFGMVPAPGLALGLGVGVRYDALLLIALGSIFADRRVTSITDAVAAKVALKRTELWLCRGWRTERWELAPCITTALEHLTFSGTGVGVSPRTRSTTVVELGANLATHLYVTEWFAIVASAGGGIRTSRPRINVDGFGQVYQVGAPRAGFSLGSEWIF